MAWLIEKVMKNYHDRHQFSHWNWGFGVYHNFWLSVAEIEINPKSCKSAENFKVPVLFASISNQVAVFASYSKIPTYVCM